MKTKISFLLFAVLLVLTSCSTAQNNEEPWSENQLMKPSELAKMLNDSSAQIPLIYNIGPSGLIKNSIDIGEGKNNQNIEKFRKELIKLPKDADIVIYCGCCPFKNCLNIRPAFNLLNELKFTNHKLLNLSQNLKVDWIDKGYPMQEN